MVVEAVGVVGEEEVEGKLKHVQHNPDHLKLFDETVNDMLNVKDIIVKLVQLSREYHMIFLFSSLN